MSRHPLTWRPAASLRAASVLAVVIALAGCAKIDSALGQQYVVVQFAPGTTLATARQVTTTCSHIPNLRLQAPVGPTTAQAGVVDSVTYNATNATDTDLSRLQVCLARFRSVQGVTTTEPGDSG